MADTEVCQVIHDRGRVGKTKARVQLDAVSGADISGHGGALSEIVTQRATLFRPGAGAKGEDERGGED